MQILAADSTYRFRLTATKDGVVFDLTGATVTLTFRRETRTASPALVASATVEGGTGGTAYYDCTTTDLADEGRWYRQWRVVLSPLDLESRQIAFLVEE